MSGQRPTSLLAAVALLAGGLWLALSGSHGALSGSHRATLVDATTRARTFTVTAALEPTSVLRNEQTVLSGTVKPVPTKNKLLVQRATDSGWTTVAHRKVKADGTYRYAFKPQQSGTWTYRARMPKVGGIKAGNSPQQVLTVATESLIVFHIPAGTHGSPWNTSDTRVVGLVGDTLRLVNDDDVAHRLHTYNNQPFPHMADDLNPGATVDLTLENPYDADTQKVYDHDAADTTALFWIDVTEP